MHGFDDPTYLLMYMLVFSVKHRVSLRVVPGGEDKIWGEVPMIIAHFKS